MGLGLSELFARYQKIQSLEFKSIEDNLLDRQMDLQQALEGITYLNKSDIEIAEKELRLSLEKYKDTIKKIENKLEIYFENNQNDFINFGKKIYDINLDKMLFHEHLEWASLWPPMNKEFEDFAALIQSFSSWQYPCLIYGAKNSSIIRSMVSAEPLYVMERFSEYFDLQKQKFTREFARKINFYNYHELAALPNNALGFAFIYNEFPFIPWDMINNILNQIITKLMPGGHIIFNYNDCETARGIYEFENQSMTYSTAKMYIDLMESRGLTCIKKYVSTSQTFSYLIFRKNGNQNLFKKYPCVGFIKEQPTLSNIAAHNKKYFLIRKSIYDK